MAYRPEDRARDERIEENTIQILGLLEDGGGPINPPPVDPPDGKVYEFDLAALPSSAVVRDDRGEVVTNAFSLPFSPSHRRDMRSIHLRDCPAGIVESVEIEVEINGLPEEPGLINRFVSLGNAKNGIGTYQHLKNFVYAVWKQGKLTLRTGWNVIHGSKTKNSVAMPLSSGALATYAFDGEYPDSQTHAVGGNWKPLAAPKGDQPPVIGNNGIVLVLSGHGDHSINEPNPNEQAMVGCTYRIVRGRVIYAS